MSPTIQQLMIGLSPLLPEPTNILNWLIMIYELSEVKEDQEVIEVGLLDTLLNHLNKVMRVWKKNAQNWEITSIENCLEKLNTQIAGTCQTSLSPLDQNILLELVRNLNLSERITREDYSFLLNMTNISTSSMTAPIQPGVAAASGRKRPASANTYDQEFVKQHK